MRSGHLSRPFAVAPRKRGCQHRSLSFHGAFLRAIVVCNKCGKKWNRRVSYVVTRRISTLEACR